jgi:hypothetical protein
MKLRNGFVSNSSSSSFIIGVKSGGKPSKAQFKELLGVVEGTVAEQLMEPYIHLFMSADPFRLDEYLDDHGYKTLEGMKTDYAASRYKLPVALELFEKGWKVYTFTVSSEDYDNPASAAMYEGNFPDIITDNVVIERG